MAAAAYSISSSNSKFVSLKSNRSAISSILGSSIWNWTSNGNSNGKRPILEQQVQWYSSSYRKRVNRRLRLASKPVLDRGRFDEAISQLPARFTAPDLHCLLSLESDPLLCLELFRWADALPRFGHSIHTYHVIVHKLGRAGMLDELHALVAQLLALPHLGSEPLFNSIIYYYTRARKLSQAVAVFKHMKKLNPLPHCAPSIRTYNLLFAAFLTRRTDTLINHMYMATIDSLFRQMLHDCIQPDIFSLNSLIQGYVLSNHVNHALRIFHQMGVAYGCNPDATTYDLLIHGLCAQGRTNNATNLFFQLKAKGFVSSAKTYNSLVNALALVGEIDQALTLLREMILVQRPVDFITYRTLLDEFRRKGKSVEAMDLLDEFKGECLLDRTAHRKLLRILKH